MPYMYTDETAELPFGNIRKPSRAEKREICSIHLEELVSSREHSVEDAVLENIRKFDERRKELVSQSIQYPRMITNLIDESVARCRS